ncbi:hypothetical protein GCM10022386_07770 [Flavobacterium cheonhonense]|uniref:RiboL-PSP-HEPN domain-containing protein n=1 Tax=Flavobacterium cheonhonense TaxID=706185 RepID=A0ABP7TIM3_9FLAO|nr:hypothetical protein [Flavobacterium cheonhonense]
MSKFDIENQRGRNICINMTCLECHEEFTTELDTNYSIENLPFFNDCNLYCIYCNTSFDYTIKIDQNVVEISFKKENIFGNLEYSDTIEPELIDYYADTTPSDSKKYYYLQIKRLEELLNIKTTEYIVKQTLNRLIYSGVITSLETYLNEILLAVTLDSNETLEKFVSNYEPYKKEQFTLSEIYSKHCGLKNRVRNDLNNLLYHNIAKIISIFNIFNFELNKFVKVNSIAKSIQKRHNFIHKSGLDEYNNSTVITENEIMELIQDTNLLIEYIDKKIEYKCYDDNVDIPF